jgi:hypothetical protein
MKSGRPKATTPRDIADRLRELRELRIKVSKAELAAARKELTAREKTKAKRAPPSLAPFDFGLICAAPLVTP